MRETAGKLNRTWLAIIGVLLLLAGVAGVLVSSDLARTAAESNNLAINPPGTEERIFSSSPLDLLSNPTAAIITIIISAVLGLLALAWLSAQVPKRHQASTFRLHTDHGSKGYTLCDPKVVASAVETHTQSLPGVTDASALLRGSSKYPELNLEIKIDDRADIQEILQLISTDVAPGLETALETQLQNLAVLINVSTRSQNDKAVTL